MDEQEEEEIAPFWLQRSTVRRRDSSSFGYILLLFFLLVVALAFIFFTIPSFLSFTGQFFRPQSVKKSWDSLNLVLVIFAIVCAFLTKSSNNDDQTLSNSSSVNNYHEDPNNNAHKLNSTPSTPNNRWFHSPNPKLNRLRSGRSYPDLQSVISWSNDNRYRFYDDTYVNEYRSDLRQQQPTDFDNVVIGNKEEVGSTTATATATAVGIRDNEVSPPSVPAPVITSELPELSKAKAVRRKARRRGESVSEEISENDVEAKAVIYLPPASPAPPPPPPPLFTKNEKRRGKDFLISLRRKKRRERQKSVDNLESLVDPQAADSSYLQPPPASPAPPTPTPPPPPPFLQGFFSSKRSKTKKSHSISTTPQPQQPYTHVSKAVHHSAPPSFEMGESKTRQQPINKITSVSAVEDHHHHHLHLDRRNAAPLIPIPPPPPPPPFNIPVWKYVVEGDYVRLQSLSRSASPELEDQSDRELSPMAMDGGDSPVKMPTPLICPSPDVNTKADNFIARFKEGLRLEKEKSIKDRGKSNLGLEINGSPVGKGPR